MQEDYTESLLRLLNGLGDYNAANRRLKKLIIQLLEERNLLKINSFFAQENKLENYNKNCSTIVVIRFDNYQEYITNNKQNEYHLILCQIIPIIKNNISKNDMIFQIDEDKFGITLSGCSQDICEERIADIFQKIRIDCNLYDFPLSAGISSFSSTKENELLLEEAINSLEEYEGSIYRYKEKVLEKKEITNKTND